jgi:hypothetical protein
MRLLHICAGYRPGLRHLTLNIEMVLALTVCALLARALVLL